MAQEDILLIISYGIQSNKQLCGHSTSDTGYRGVRCSLMGEGSSGDGHLSVKALWEAGMLEVGLVRVLIQPFRNSYDMER